MPDYISGSIYRCRPAEFALLVGVSVKTLQRWDRTGKLSAGRMPSGRRFYTELHYAACGGDAAMFKSLTEGRECHDK